MRFAEINQWPLDFITRIHVHVRDVLSRDRDKVILAQAVGLHRFVPHVALCFRPLTMAAAADAPARDAGGADGRAP